jgi:predicted nucleic acid-binding protein
MEYFFDTYAIIELIKANPKYESVKEKVITTSLMNLAELYYALLLENKKEIVDSIINSLNFEILEISSEIALSSALFRYKNKSLNLSYIDCIGYILSLKNSLLFLTGDKSFKNLKNVEFISK